MAQHPRIFVSTACVARQFATLGELLQAFEQARIPGVELGHCPPLAGWDPAVWAAHYRGRALVHNYFPPPAEPFVLNLASQDPVILERSLALAESAIRLSGQLAAPFYSVHCGFLAEFTPSHLGARLEADAMVDYEVAYRTFVASIRRLLDVARREGIKLLVEPNVVAPFNLQAGRNRLLQLAEPGEFRRFLQDLPEPDLGVLLDLGHLKVTARTLGFETSEFVAAVEQRVAGFHLHDNDGSADQHRPMMPNGWMMDIISQPMHRNKPMTIEAAFPSMPAMTGYLHLLEQALVA